MRFPLSSVLCTVLAVALAGCTPSPSATPEPGPAAGEDARPQEGSLAKPTPGTGQGSVTIAGEDATEDVQRWTPPRVDRQGRSVAQLRRAAEKAFSEGHLY
ncbi:formylglycine-generating enzyme family protein, partial [Stenotrophomonas maltophilia]|nr:formylglycine-generating enzyme family protein [Stenotrophomonas maltophilia]